MAELSFEQEQLEKLKNWWHKHKVIASVCAVLFLAGYGGWEFRQYSVSQQLEEASDIFADMLELDKQLSVITSTDEDGSQQIANFTKQIFVSNDKLVSDYSGVMYSSLSQLLAAKYAVADNNLEKAAQSLKWVVEANFTDELFAIASLRLAKVLWAQGKITQALASLLVDMPESFASARSELEGDLYVASGELEKARSAYEYASSQGRASKHLQRKRNDIKLAEK